MALFRYKGSKVWTMDFFIHGQRIRESTGMTSKTLAKEVEGHRRQELKNGVAGIKKPKAPRLLSLEAEAWLALKQGKISANSLRIEKTNLGHLLPVLGRQLVCDIDEVDLARYQNQRI